MTSFTLGDVTQQLRMAGGWAITTNETARYMGHNTLYVQSWRHGDWLLFVDLLTADAHRDRRAAVPATMANDLSGHNKVMRVTFYDESGYDPRLVAVVYDLDWLRVLLSHLAGKIAA